MLLVPVLKRSSLYGKDVILRPYRRCAWVNGSGSCIPDNTKVNGQSFRIVSISITTVCSVGLSNNLLRVDFVILSHHPPFQGARFGMNCWAPVDYHVSESFSDWSKLEHSFQVGRC